MTMPHRARCLVLLCLFLAGAASAAIERLPNGIRFLVLPTTASQIVSVELLLDCSAFDEPAEMQGLRHVLLTDLLQDLSPATLQARKVLDAIGGSLEGRVHQDMLEFTVTAPADALPEAIAALAATLRSPALSQAGLETALALCRRRVEIAPSGARDLAFLIADDLLYANHPYHTRGYGSTTTLTRITPDLVRQAAASYLSPSRGVLTVVGRCDVDTTRTLIRNAFSDWSGPTRPARRIVAPSALRASSLIFREAPVRSTCVMLAFPSPGADHADFLTLRVIDALLGGGSGARLFRTIREEKRLAYEVTTFFPSQAAAGTFSLYALTDHLYLEETKAALVAELARLQTEPVSGLELKRAKAYLKGRYLLSHQYSVQHAFDLGWYELLGLGVGYDDTLNTRIDAITERDVQRVARSYFTHYLLVVVVPQTVAHAGSSPGSLSARCPGVSSHR